MIQKRFLQLALPLMVFLFAACSTKKQANNGADSAAGSSEDQILTASLEDNGVINFFDIRGVEKGLVVRQIKWGEPVTSDNPGADCELKRKSASSGAGNASAAFA